MAPAARVSPLEAWPELRGYVSARDLDEIARVRLPVITVDNGVIELHDVLREHGAFGATVLEGIVMNSLRVGDQTGIQLLGPGDLLIEGSEPMPSWLRDADSRAAASVRLALFGNDLLAVALRWPRIIQGLYAGVADQLQRLTAQLVICQLPRVDERVLAMLWLLSESWGYVTPSGVRLPLALTHEMIGGLVGARRPTVTLALRKLVQDGAIVHQDSGWLLLEQPAQSAEPAPKIVPPQVEQPIAGPWAREQEEDRSAAYAELLDTVRRLRERHQFDRQVSRDQLNVIRTARVRMSATRQRIEADALRRRQPPSS
jgi:CRP/FNR family transcriptional regulator, cyclic AMP receptor protein